MVEDYTDVDFFSEGDLAEPELLPEKRRVLGRITKVDLSQSEPGNFRKLSTSKDGRTEVPVISLGLVALKFATGEEFAEGNNYRVNGKQDYWIGKPDRVGRHSLANLIMKVSGVPAEELAGVSVRDAAVNYLPNAYVTFEVSYRQAKIQGIQMQVQDFSGLRSASEAEKAFAV